MRVKLASMSTQKKKPLRSYAANGFKIRGQGQAIRVLSSEARKIPKYYNLGLGWLCRSFGVRATTRVLLPLGKKSLASPAQQFFYYWNIRCRPIKLI